MRKVEEYEARNKMTNTLSSVKCFPILALEYTPFQRSESFTVKLKAILTFKDHTRNLVNFELVIYDQEDYQVCQHTFFVWNANYQINLSMLENCLKRYSC